jgi:hypothetical protein
MTDEPLTPEQREAYLAELGYSKRAFADLLGLDDRMVRRWLKNPDIWVPPEYDAWLRRRGEAARVYNAAFKADPPPTKPPGVTLSTYRDQNSPSTDRD